MARWQALFEPTIFLDEADDDGCILKSSGLSLTQPAD